MGGGYRNPHKCCASGHQVLQKGDFPRFGVLRVLISDEGTHFIERTFETKLTKYRVYHKKELGYHPQIGGQTEISNREIKVVLEMMVVCSRKHWSDKLHDALWAYRTTFKTPIGTTQFRLVYSKPCQFTC